MPENPRISKIAIVGCGEIADFHLPAIRAARPQAELSFCDLDAERANALAARAGGGPVYISLQQLIEEVAPDSVHILTSAQTHVPLTRLALQAGCHVLVEKPAADRKEEIDALYELAESRGKVLSADHTLLGMPIVRQALGEIRSGRMGGLIAAHCDFGAARGARLPYDAGHWAYSMRGGVVANNASHPASLLIELMGPILDFNVQSATRNLLPNTWPDVIHVALRSREQLGSFTLTQGHGNADRRAHLLFERGCITLDFTRQLATYSRGMWPRNFIQKASSGVFEGLGSIMGTLGNIYKVATKKLPKNPGLYNIVRNFYDAVEHGAELHVSSCNVRGVTELMDGVWSRIEQEAISDPRPGREPQLRADLIGEQP